MNRKKVSNIAKIGIDISTWNYDIDLKTLKNNGSIDFAIIRAGFGYPGTVDNKFKRNADLCRDINLPFGFYWYSYALNVEQAIAEANFLIDLIEPYKDIYSYGVWFDMEDADGWKARHGMPSNQTLREMCAAFCDTMENAGYYAGVYASLSWFNNQLNGAELNPYDKWVAQWPCSGGKQRGLDVRPEERTNYNLWQFTSEAYFDGWPNRVDANYAYIDYPAIIRGEQPQPTPTPVPPIPTTDLQIGDDVIVSGGLYTNANAANPVGYVNNRRTQITRIALGTKHPYNTTGDLGWVDRSAIVKVGGDTFQPSILSVGTNVRTIATGNGASDGSSVMAQKGLTGTITRIIEGAKYPYLVSTNGVPMGWYQANALEVI